MRKVSDIWDLTERGRGYAENFTPAGRLAFISKQEGVPGGHSLFVLSGGLAAWRKGLPSVARCAGPRPTRPSGLRADTLPTLCGGGAAARPVTALQAVPGNVAAKAGQARPGQVGRLRCSGAPFRAARPSTFGARSARPCPAPPPRRSRRRCSGAARPPRCGGYGAVRPSGPVGGASASLASPATPTAQAVPRGSAYALAARRSGVAALAASSGQAGPRPAACGLAPTGARNLCRRAHWRRKRRLPRASRAAGRRERRLRAGVPAVAPAGKAKASPAQGGKPPTSGGLACRVPGQRGKPWRVSRPLAGLPPLSHSGKRWCFSWSCGLSPVVCLRLLLRSGSGLCLLLPLAVSAALVCAGPLLAGVLLGLPVGFSHPVRRLCGLSLPLVARRLCPVGRLPLCGGRPGLPLCGCLCLLALKARASVRPVWVAASLPRAGGARHKKAPPGDKAGGAFLLPTATTTSTAGPKRQHARRQRRTAYESEARHTGAAPVGGFLRR